MGGISLITIYDRKFRHNRPEEGFAEDDHLYFAYKSPFGFRAKSTIAEIIFILLSCLERKIFVVYILWLIDYHMLLPYTCLLIND